MSTMTMAKAKPKKPIPVRPPEEKASLRQPTAITVRGSREWREWMERGARHCRTDSSKLIDIAVAQYLKAQGFNEPPPER